MVNGEASLTESRQVLPKKFTDYSQVEYLETCQYISRDWRYPGERIRIRLLSPSPTETRKFGERVQKQQTTCERWGEPTMCIIFTKQE